MSKSRRIPRWSTKRPALPLPKTILIRGADARPPMSSDFQTPSDSTRPPIDAQPPSSAPVAPSSARKSRAWLLFWGIIGGCLVGLIGLTVLMAVLGAATGSTRGADWTLVGGSRIAIVPIEGEILDSRDTIDAIHRY